MGGTGLVVNFYLNNKYEPLNVLQGQLNLNEKFDYMEKQPLFSKTTQVKGRFMVLPQDTMVQNHTLSLVLYSNGSEHGIKLMWLPLCEPEPEYPKRDQYSSIQEFQEAEDQYLLIKEAWCARNQDFYKEFKDLAEDFLNQDYEQIPAPMGKID